MKDFVACALILTHSGEAIHYAVKMHTQPPERAHWREARPPTYHEQQLKGRGLLISVGPWMQTFSPQSQLTSGLQSQERPQARFTS